jgi:hypothetical protein
VAQLHLSLKKKLTSSMDYQHTREESSWKIETHAYQRIMVIIKWQLDKFQKVKKKILEKRKRNVPLLHKMEAGLVMDRCG